MLSLVRPIVMFIAVAMSIVCLGPRAGADALDEVKIRLREPTRQELKAAEVALEEYERSGQLGPIEDPDVRAGTVRALAGHLLDTEDAAGKLSQIETDDDFLGFCSCLGSRGIGNGTFISQPTNSTSAIVKRLHCTIWVEEMESNHAICTSATTLDVRFIESPRNYFELQEGVTYEEAVLIAQSLKAGDFETTEEGNTWHDTSWLVKWPVRRIAMADPSSFEVNMGNCCCGATVHVRVASEPRADTPMLLVSPLVANCF